MARSEAHSAWFQTERGITSATLDHFGVRSDGDIVVIPYTAGGEKHRKGIPNGERRFWFTAGKKPWLFNPKDAAKRFVFLVEGETDTMRLWQELGDQPSTGVVGLSGIDTWQDSMADALAAAETVWVVLDNDEDYNTKAQVDSRWRSIRQHLGSKAKRIKLPGDVKDICEFFDNYDLDALRTLVEQTPVVTHYKPLDLTTAPPPPDWLAHQWIAKGDMTVLLGESNVGKSFFTLSLAVAVAEGHDTWLGLPLDPGNRRVLYVDEENPQDVVVDRLWRLGLTSEGMKNLRYLHDVGIRLDRDPDKLLDDAEAWAPTLIVLDSLTRIHTQDENSAGAVSTLFNDGIKPLARRTKAAVIILHHSSKTESTSSFKRSRGSGDITGAIDAGLDARAVDTDGLVAVTQYKTRRRGKHSADAILHVRIEDTPEGGVRLRRIVEVEPPF